MKAADMTIDLAEQIKCVERELGFRRRVYPRFVADGRMIQSSADRELARMQAVLETLEALAAKGQLF